MKVDRVTLRLPRIYRRAVKPLILGSPGYIREVDNFIDDFKKNEASLYGPSWEKEMARRAIEKIMRDVNNYANIKGIGDDYWRVLCYKINDLVVKAKAVSKEVHYFRLKLNRAPNSLDELIRINKEVADDKKWILLSVEESALHMFGSTGAYNTKFVSYDGIYEAVYNKDKILLDEKNDPVNMGTYNYSSHLFDAANHALLDVWPYTLYGNTIDSGRPEPGADNENKEKYYSDPYAIAHRTAVKELLGW